MSETFILKTPTDKSPKSSKVETDTTRNVIIGIIIVGIIVGLVYLSVTTITKEKEKAQEDEAARLKNKVKKIQDSNK